MQSPTSIDVPSLVNMGGPTAAVVLVLTLAAVVLWRTIGREVLVGIKEIAAKHAEAQASTAATTRALQTIAESQQEMTQTLERMLSDFMRLNERQEAAARRGEG